MTLGVEPKKIAILGALVVIGAYTFYTNVLSHPGAPAEEKSAAPSRAEPVIPAAGVPAPSAAPVPRRPGTRARTEEFRPSLKPRRPEERLDPMSIDPTLRLDLLAKVQQVELDGGARNLFQFSAPPAPALKTPEPKIVPKLPGQSAAKEEPPPADAPAAKKPSAPPINLKYYGYSVVRGANRKQAFFLDGDEILVAGEGETLKRRYRVVRIGLTSVVMEDTESKSQQTLPLVEEGAAG